MGMIGCTSFVYPQQVFLEQHTVKRETEPSKLTVVGRG